MKLLASSLGLEGSFPSRAFSLFLAVLHLLPPTYSSLSEPPTPSTAGNITTAGPSNDSSSLPPAATHMSEDCKRLLHCQHQLMSAYHQCTERPKSQNNPTANTCPVEDEMAALRSLIDERLRIYGACVEAVSSQVGTEKSRLKYNGAGKCKKSSEVPNYAAMDCWKRIFVAHTECKALRECCPQAAM